MGVRYMIMVVDPNQKIFDANIFISQAQQRWAECEAFKLDLEKHTSDATANVDSTNAPPFHIDHFPSDQMISVDGNPYNSAEVAAWARSLLPDPNLALWLIDQPFSGHTVLFPGITPQQVLDNWVDHSEHDPYTEYPQYFQYPPPRSATKATDGPSKSPRST